MRTILAVVSALAALATLSPAREPGGLEEGVLDPLGEFALPYSAEYVGSETCGKCHQAQAETQATHHMALTGLAVGRSNRGRWFSAERLAAPVDWPDELGGPAAAPSYRATDAGVVLEASGTASDPVVAMLGSGVHGNTPITVEPGRRIRELRLSYSDVRGGWFVTPGSERAEDPTGSLKTPEESRECLACHATVAVWRDDGVLDEERTVFGVQCERCHGPGSAHVEAVTRGTGSPAIFQPGLLTGSEQVRFCGQCHRQPTDFEPLEVLGRSPTLARHAGASLMMSACFRRSPPETTIACVDCHDPHRNVLESDRARYRKSCLRCHASPETEHRYERVDRSSDCIGCHMPLESEGFHGMTFTDHWIRAPGSAPPLGAETEDANLDYLELLYRNAWEEPQGPEKRSRLALGLAEVLYGQARPDDAFRWVRESLSHAPKPQHRLKSAAMLREGGRAEEAKAVLAEAVTADPDLVRAHFDLGEIAREAGDFDEAREHYLRALEVRSDFFEARQRLGLTLIAQERFAEASEAFRRALALDPESTEARIGLALSRQREGRLDEALEAYREALRLAPQAPPALNGIAWILATHPDAASRGPEEAVRLAERAAVATAYRHPEILDTLGAAHAAAGDFETAANAAERAIAIYEAAGAEARAEEVRARLHLYRERRAFVAPPGRSERPDPNPL